MEKKGETQVAGEETVWVFGMLAEEYYLRFVWVCAFLLASGICYAILRNGFSGPLLGAAGMVVFFAILMAATLAPSSEVILAARLKVEEGTQKTVGKIVGFKRRGGSDTSTGVTLTVALQANGELHQARIKATIENALLADFGTGKSIHLLYDPGDPARVAIDREASPTYVR